MLTPMVTAGEAIEQDEHRMMKCPRCGGLNCMDFNPPERPTDRQLTGGPGRCQCLDCIWTGASYRFVEHIPGEQLLDSTSPRYRGFPLGVKRHEKKWRPHKLG